MRKKLLLATQNPGKIKELRELLKDAPVELVVPEEDFDVEETGSTFEENARLKAEAWSKRYPDHLVLAEDSGLVVNALDGRPGVYSKRYGKDDLDRNQKLIAEMEGMTNRSAYFICVMDLMGPGVDVTIEGRVNGRIATELHEGDGFGYDPVFIPDGYEKTFSELGTVVKHQLSHRARATSQVVDFLKSILGAHDELSLGDLK